MIQISFLEPDKKHPKSESSVYEVAKKLEKEYKLCDKFVRYIDEKLHKRMMTITQRQLRDVGKVNKELVFFQLSEFLQKEWRKYISQEKHAIITRASLERGGKSFIDTKAYYRNMVIEIKER